MIKKLILAAANAATALLLIVLLSPGLFNLFSRPFPLLLVGLAGGISAVAGCLMFDYRILFAKPSLSAIPIDEDGENGPEEYIEMLQHCMGKAFFQKDLAACIDQIRRFEKKKQMNQLLLTAGEAGGQEYEEKCAPLLQRVTDIFYDNVKALVTRAILFDEAEYELFQQGRLELATPQARSQKGAFYQNLAKVVDEITNQNEEILLQLDELALEMTRANTANEWDTETIVTMKKLAELIEKTKRKQDLEKEVGEAVCQQLKM